jgi:flagellar hook-length control protein FliK
MATAVIDALLQTTVPSRPPETGGNGAEGGSFKPALDQALRAEASGAAAAASGPTASEEEPPVADEEIDDAEWNEPEGDAATEVAEAATSEQATNEESAEEDGKDDERDAVEISETAAAGAAVEAAAAALAVTVNARTETAVVGDEAPAEAAEKVDGAATKNPVTGQKEPPLKPKGTQEVPSGGEEPAAQVAVEIGDVIPDDAETGKETGKRGKASVDSAVKGEGTPETAGEQSRSEDGKLSLTQDDSQDDSLASEAAVTAADESAPENGDERRPSTPAASKTAEVLNAESPAPVTAAPDPAAAATATPDQVAAASAAAPSTAEPSSATRSSPSLALLAAGRALQGSPDSDEHGTSQVDRGRFLGRVEGAIRTAQQRDGRVHVRLSPPELGALRIELTLQHGVMNARIEAETTSARNLLLDNLPALRDRLAQQDIRVERFDVDVRRDGGGSNPQNANDRPAGDSGSEQQDERRRDRAAPVSQAGPIRRSAAPQTSGNAELDVRV